MTLPLIQLGVTCFLLTYAGIWRRGQTKKIGRSWDDLVTLLQFCQIAIEPVMEEDVGDLWTRIGGMTGLWALFRRVPLLIEIADYAAQNGQEINEELLCTLRSDAMKIRLSVLSIMSLYALTRSKVQVLGSLSESVASYRQMLARVSEFSENQTSIALADMC